MVVEYVDERVVPDGGATTVRAIVWATRLVALLTLCTAILPGPRRAFGGPLRSTLDLPAAGEAPHPSGITVAHLLAHAAGLPFERGAPVAPPGTRRTYSNYGYELLGDHLADVLLYWLTRTATSAAEKGNAASIAISKPP